MSSIKAAIKSAVYPLYERRLLSKLDLTKTPHHVGVILDGNRRWALANPSRSGDTSSSHGHRAGASKIVELLNWCEECSISIVTIWLLSSDNFKRESDELAALFEIIGETVTSLASTGKWRVRPVGALERLPPQLQETLAQVEARTSHIPGITVNVAVGYGGRLEIVDAVKRYITDSTGIGKTAGEIAAALSAEKIEQYLYTAGQPDPELVIRTSGEQRLGGFLLWQSHQSEFYFCEAYWPDFRKVDFLRALRSYSARQRRLGR